MQDKCDTPPEVETSLEVVNLAGVPVTFQLGDGDEIAVPGFESFKVVEKATSGLKDTLKTNVRLAATGGGETPIDVEAGAEALFVATTDGLTVKVSRQTQGQSFGEKVASGLHAAGSALAQGASLSVDSNGDCLADVGVEIGARATVSIAESPSKIADCAGAKTFVAPDAESTPYFVPTDNGPVIAWVRGEPRTGQTSGRRTFDPKVKITAPLPEVYVLNAHEQQLAASVTAGGVSFASMLAPASMVRVSPTAIGAAAVLTAEVSTGGSVQVPLDSGDVLIIIAKTPAVMRMGQNNQLARGRRDLKFGSVVFPTATGCQSAIDGDDACLMAVAVSSIGGAGGGAASASYAATGRVIAPANVTGTPKLPFIYSEDARRFAFTLPGDSVRELAARGGFFVVSAGSSTDQRTLYWVDNSSRPWTLTTVTSP